MLLLWISNKAYCQNIKSSQNKPKSDSIAKQNNLPILYSFICRKIETAAVFPGGDSAWAKYLEQNLNINNPKINGSPVGIYNVVVLFMISRDGSPNVLRCTTNFGYGMEPEVIRIIERSPRWKPATQDGHIVNAYKRDTLTFSVTSPAFVFEYHKAVLPLRFNQRRLTNM